MTAATLPVVVNRSGGTAARLGDTLADVLTEAFAGAGVPVELHLLEGKDIAPFLTGLEAPVVAVGGGDGTLGQAAAVLAGRETAMAILPLGTRNHLARQLEIPLDLADAAEALAAGQPRSIDLAQGNDRIFVNNASIGLYTRLVRERERHAGPKWLGTIPAAWFVLRHSRAKALRLTIDGAVRSLATPLLFIGNNRYSLDSGHVGKRDGLSDGILSVFAVQPKSPQRLITFAVRALFGRADPERDFTALAEAREVIVEGSGPIEVAFDGEVETMQLPLRFTILPGALKVIAPASPRRPQ